MQTEGQVYGYRLLLAVFIIFPLVSALTTTLGMGAQTGNYLTSAIIAITVGLFAMFLNLAFGHYFTRGNFRSKFFIICSMILLAPAIILTSSVYNVVWLGKDVLPAIQMQKYVDYLEASQSDVLRAAEGNNRLVDGLSTEQQYYRLIGKKEVDEGRLSHRSGTGSVSSAYFNAADRVETIVDKLNENSDELYQLNTLLDSTLYDMKMAQSTDDEQTFRRQAATANSHLIKMAGKVSVQFVENELTDLSKYTLMAIDSLKHEEQVTAINGLATTYEATQSKVGNSLRECKDILKTLTFEPFNNIAATEASKLYWRETITFWGFGLAIDFASWLIIIILPIFRKIDNNVWVAKSVIQIVTEAKDEIDQTGKRVIDEVQKAGDEVGESIRQTTQKSCTELDARRFDLKNGNGHKKPAKTEA
jgi:hypothetical protein